MGVIQSVRSWLGVDQVTPVHTGHTYTDTVTNENIVIDSVGSTFVRFERQDAERRPYSKIETDRFRDMIDNKIVEHNQDACLHCRPETDTDV